MPYELAVVLVHFLGEEPSEAGDKADELADRIDAALNEKLVGPEYGIAFRGCMTVSEDDIRLGEAQTLMRWRLDFITLKVDTG